MTPLNLDFFSRNQTLSPGQNFIEVGLPGFANAGRWQFKSVNNDVTVRVDS